MMRPIQRSLQRTAMTCLIVLGTVLPTVAEASSTPGIGQSYGVHVAPTSSTAQENPGLAKQAKSAVLMDAASGKVLYQKDAHQRLPMASITKIMTMLLIVEAVDKGILRWDEPIKASEYAASMGGSQIFLEPGESMKVSDMLKGIAVASGNDACVAMAEHLSGSEEAFVGKMNQRAAQLGMKDTHFSNSNGLPIANHYSSAYDISLMSRELLKHKEITKWTSVYSDYLRKDTARPLWLVNTNKLVRFYDGVDGLKTGYTQEAKYCLSATAKRGDFRVIAVVMGEPRPPIRNAEVTGMLNFAFSQYSSKTLYQAHQVVAKSKVIRGVKSTVDAMTESPVSWVVEKGNTSKYETKLELTEMKAPVQMGQRIGTLKVFEGTTCISEVPLLAKETIVKAGFFHNLGRTIKKVVTFGMAKD
jgi:serine-type D-Ala-D-Ala carboxypeptidase (penicillin-binding protein 5/6)